jgi:hypothetical protein
MGGLAFIVGPFEKLVSMYCNKSLASFDIKFLANCGKCHKP